MPSSHSLVPIDTQTTPILRLLPDYLIHCQSTNQYIRSPHCQVLMATQVTHILRLPLQTTLGLLWDYAHSKTTPFLKLLPNYFMQCQSTNQYTRPIPDPLPGVDGHTGYSHSRLPLHTTLIMPIHRPLPFSNYSQTTLCIVNLLTNTPSPSHCQVLMATQATPILDQPSITLRLLPSSDYHRLLNPL